MVSRLIRFAGLSERVRCCMADDETLRRYETLRRRDDALRRYETLKRKLESSA